MKIFAKILAVFCMSGFAFGQTIEVQAGVAGFDLVDALAAVNGGDVVADTLLLVTDGGIYELSEADSISVPMTIMAAPGLTDKPIIRAAAGDTCGRFFSVWADLALEGVILDGERTDGTLNPFTEEEMISGVQNPDGSWGRFDLTIKDCELRNVYASGDPDPVAGTDGNIFALNTDGFLGNFVIEGSIFENVIDEAIIMQNAYKTTAFGDGRAADTVIVRNSTFINCAGPKNQSCFTIKGDDDTTTVDAKIILENLTFYNSGPNCIYSRENEGMVIRNIVIANTHPTGDNDQLIRTDRDGSVVSHVDTFAIGPLLGEDAIRVGPGANTLAGMAALDSATVYGFDPAFTDAANGDLTLLSTSEICGLGSDGGALGDRRWAINCPTFSVDEVPLNPRGFSLSQNYPNPFNPATTINYTLESRAAVKLEIFDLTGSRVATLVDGVKSVGSHTIVWDATSMASGIYFYKLTAEGHSMTRKMMFLK